MVVNVGTKTLAPGQTYIFDSVGGVLKRVYFRVTVGSNIGITIGDMQLSFTDTFSENYTFFPNNPVFEMRSDQGTYQGKIFLRNISLDVTYTITYIEILQP